jgi:hypothetical protein
MNSQIYQITAKQIRELRKHIRWEDELGANKILDEIEGKKHKEKENLEAKNKK